MIILVFSVGIFCDFLSFYASFYLFLFSIFRTSLKITRVRVSWLKIIVIIIIIIIINVACSQCMGLYSSVGRAPQRQRRGHHIRWVLILLKSRNVLRVNLPLLKFQSSLRRSYLHLNLSDNTLKDSKIACYTTVWKL